MIDNDYSAMFGRFFKSPHMASTYKPVFLKALLDVGDLADPSKNSKIVGREWLRVSGDRLFVDLNFIAVRFAKCYWDMEHRFKLRQSQDRQNANILRVIGRARNPSKNTPTLKFLASDRMSEFRTKVIAKSIRPEVLVHLKLTMPDLYKKENPNQISLDQRAVRYFNQNKAMITSGLDHVMTKYLERINPAVPNISKKINCRAPIRPPKLHKQVVASMIGWQDSCCFYCGRKLAAHHVDHVIPFNFVFSTDLYNCVLACQRCNCKKSDLLPVKGQFDEVLARNHKKCDYMTTKQIVYSEESYSLLFDTCMVEYSGKKFFRPD